jgi:murein L,D-transpeptidase YcbB/YkuD
VPGARGRPGSGAGAGAGGAGGSGAGKTQSKTPAFSNRITRIDLNPIWHLPSSIVQNEIAPAVARDPGYLARKNLEVVKGSGEGLEKVSPGDVDWSRMGRGDYPYRVRQPSGPDNALGRIKFVIPDSSTSTSTTRRRRAYSTAPSAT